MRGRPILAAWALAGATVALAGAADGLAAPVHYALRAGSTFEQGCYPPCRCALEQTPISGHFTLTLDHVDPLFTYYTVSDIDWRGEDATTLRVTGSGTYRIGGEVAIMHQLVLEVSINGGPPERFDSGTIAGGGGFPAIEIAVSQNQMVCYDTVFRIVAKPAPPPGGVLYRLTDKSTYQQGCFDLCECAVWEPVPMAGTFRLVPQGFDGLFHNFAVADVKFTARLGDHEVVLTGSGHHRLGGEFALTQQMRLDLSVSGGEVMHLDSGLVVGGAGFPAIDVLVSTNTGCFDIRLDIHARPAGDFDLDGDVDQADAGRFESCATGPGAGPNVTLASPECAICDLDGDGDADQTDFGILQRCLSGPDTPAAPGCGE